MATKVAKIVRFHRIGPAEVLQLDELPLPEPGKGEVRLRVKAIGLNRAEVYFRQNRHPAFAPKVPSKIGLEASGIVEAVGPGVDPSWLGKTASTVPAFPADAYGVYGEVAIVPISAVAEYPAHLSYEEGASIWMQYITAYGALIYEGKLTRRLRHHHGSEQQRRYRGDRDHESPGRHQHCYDADCREEGGAPRPRR